MHVLEKLTGNNVISWIQFSFFHFSCQFSLIKSSILSYSNSSFWCIYQCRRSSRIFFIPGQHSNIISGQIIYIPRVAEYSLFGGSLAMIDMWRRRNANHNGYCCRVWLNVENNQFNHKLFRRNLFLTWKFEDIKDSFLVLIMSKMYIFVFAVNRSKNNSHIWWSQHKR